MAGMRVYELARDLGISSKNLIEELRNQGIDVKSHMSTMDEETAGLVLDLYRPTRPLSRQILLQRKALQCSRLRLLRLRHLL
jgi:hypothetical protein